MRAHDVRYRIRGLMIAVAAVACLFSMPNDRAVTVVAFSALGLALWTARSLLLGGYRQRAAVCFWVLGTLANAMYAACCICPFHIVRVFLFVVWMLFVFPILTGFGIAWAKLATRESAIPQRPECGLASSHLPGADASIYALDAVAITLAVLRR